ncbi:MAG: SH3 domain-containing protein [Akkermansiaceae bacterium]
MKSLRSLSTVISVFALSLLPAWGQESEVDRSAEVEHALQVVQEYIAAEQSAAGERVESRSGMLEFKFRSTRENGNLQVLNERAWREWELNRSSKVQRLQMIGEPQVVSIGKNLVRIDCAVHLNTIEDGKNWEGVSMRSFEVHLNEESPRIRHERLLANREGIKPGQWKKLKKTEDDVRSNLRSSPTMRKSNIIGKVESGEAVHVWDQEDERWLFIRTDSGQVGFIHRSQIDFTAPPERTGEQEIVNEIKKKKNHPFAVVLPGKPGYVLNPYTDTIVDVRGLRAGILVRDPHDPVKERAFRVPFQGTPGRAVIIKE